ncbi:MAG: hypothetical protein HY243_02205 [Proteobacteria bacterium]|nr:hypothetical protein [Pseudomonadota bacterium]
MSTHLTLKPIVTINTPVMAGLVPATQDLEDENRMQPVGRVIMGGRHEGRP